MLKNLRVSHLVLLAPLVLAGVHRAAVANESVGEYIDDAAVTAKVKTELLRDRQVSGTAIEVETFKGTVQLSGFANSDAERQRAVLLAKSVGGVKAVVNDIHLKAEAGQ
jgi:hyperosmotically inducible periplasmic protein